MKRTQRFLDSTTRSRPSLETWAVGDVNMRQSKSISEHTRNKPRARTFIYHWGDRERGNKPVPRYEGRILYELSKLGDSVRRYAQDLAAALPREHMYHIHLAHECVALVHVDAEDLLYVDVDRLLEGTRTHVVQESMLAVRTYESRVRESVRVRGILGPQHCPGPEMPTWCVVMVHLRSTGGHDPLVVIRPRIGGDLAFGRKVAGQTPDFLLPVIVIVVKDDISLIILAVGTAANPRLQRTI